jgi:hypothetical protein
MVQGDEVLLHNKTLWNKIKGRDRIVVNIYEDTSFEFLLGGTDYVQSIHFMSN